MSQSRVELDTDEIFRQGMQSSSVQAAVANRSAKIAARTRRDLGRAGIDATVAIREHYLPTGRASMNVEVTVSQDSDLRRAGRIVRRAGREVRR